MSRRYSDLSATTCTGEFHGVTSQRYVVVMIMVRDMSECKEKGHTGQSRYLASTLVQR